MSKIISLTAPQGTTLTRVLLSLKFPDKVGDPAKGGRQWTHDDLSAIDEKLRALKKALKRVSPIWEEEDKLWFGRRDAYAVKNVPKKEPGPGDDLIEDGDAPAKTEKAYDYDQSKTKLTTDVEMNGSAARGLALLCYLWLDPQSQQRLAIGAQDELAWPIVEQLKAVPWMRSMLGLDKKVQDEIAFEDEKIEALPASATPALPAPAKA